MVERMRFLCKQKGTNFKKLEAELHLGNGSLAKSSDKMQCGRLNQVANYFGVTMEYLLTGKEADPDAHPVYPGLSPDAVELARSYMGLSPELKNAVRRTAGLDDLEESEKKEKEA